MTDDETRGTRADPGAPTADGSIGAAGVAPTQMASDETIIPSWGSGSFAALPEPGYQLGELIGRGGMGEVLVAQDQRIGREVAALGADESGRGPGWVGGEDRAGAARIAAVQLAVPHGLRLRGVGLHHRAFAGGEPVDVESPDLFGAAFEKRAQIGLVA